MIRFKVKKFAIKSCDGNLDRVCFSYTRKANIVGAARIWRTVLRYSLHGVLEAVRALVDICV